MRSDRSGVSPGHWTTAATRTGSWSRAGDAAMGDSTLAGGAPLTGTRRKALSARTHTAEPSSVKASGMHVAQSSTIGFDPVPSDAASARWYQSMYASRAPSRERTPGPTDGPEPGRWKSSWSTPLENA